MRSAKKHCQYVDKHNLFSPVPFRRFQNSKACLMFRNTFFQTHFEFCLCAKIYVYHKTCIFHIKHFRLKYNISVAKMSSHLYFAGTCGLRRNAPHPPVQIVRVEDTRDIIYLARPAQPRLAHQHFNILLS